VKLDCLTARGRGLEYLLGAELRARDAAAPAPSSKSSGLGARNRPGVPMRKTCSLSGLSPRHRTRVESDYDATINRAFHRCTEKAQQARLRHIQETNARQAKRGFIGKSTGDAQLLGKAINASCAALAKDLVAEIDHVLTIGGDDVPPNAAEDVSGRFDNCIEFLGGLAARSAKDYLGSEGGLNALPLTRIQMEWGLLRADLAEEFALLVRKHRASRATPGKSNPVRILQSQVGPVHFADYSGTQFERLVFAFALRTGWSDVRWLGEGGGDGGRDIWCTAEDGTATVILCANHRRLSFTKASSDLKKLTKLATRPDKTLLVTGGRVSAVLREKIEAEAMRLGFPECPVWAGTEFEERIRLQAESLLKRFCQGVEFPDAPDELATFAAQGGGPAETGVSALPALSAEAKRLLCAMAQAEDGNLLRTRTMEGYCLTVNEREFLPHTAARRVIAQWERVIDQLLELDLIEPEGCGGELFAITAGGYEAIGEGGPIL
jgi:hypothetical protein